MRRRQTVAAVCKSGFNPVAALFYSRVGQPYKVKSGQSCACRRLYNYLVAVYSVYSEACTCNNHNALLPKQIYPNYTTDLPKNNTISAKCQNNFSENA